MSTTSSTTSGSRASLVLWTVLYAGVGGFLVLWPDPSAPQQVLREVQLTLLDFGADRATLRRWAVETAVNLALAVPAPVLASRWFPRVPWWTWLPVGCAASVSAELFQHLAAPDGRTASLRDVAANTAGVVLGSLVVAGRQRRAAA